MIKEVRCAFIGTCPLIMRSARLANPLDPLARALHDISTRRKKSEADIREMGRIEWYGALYLRDGRPCVPSDAIEATFFNAAKANRRKIAAKSAFYVNDSPYLQYDGPQDIDRMWEDDTFHFLKTVAVQGKRVLRMRPIFHKWRIDATCLYEDGILSEDEVWKHLEYAGKYVGLLEWRPRYGRFTVGRL